MSSDASTRLPDDLAKRVGEPDSGFLSTLSGRFNEGVTKLNASLSLALENLATDPSNPELLATYQSKLSEYTLYRNAQSNVVKVYKDVSSAIVANFR